MNDTVTTSEIHLYSEDLKSDHSKSGNIQNPDFKRVRVQMVQFSNGWPIAMFHKNLVILQNFKTSPNEVETFRYIHGCVDLFFQLSLLPS